MDNYYEKYLKYKHKYLELKNDKYFDSKTKHKYLELKNNKYFDSKTKHKYLELKNNKINQKGGRYITNYNSINRFSTIEYPEMEEFLNPIYGCFLAESDFIRNNFFLYKDSIVIDDLILSNNFELLDKPNSSAIIIDNSLRKKINNLVQNIEGTPTVKPTNEVTQIKPIDFGRFIAILYFTKIHNGLISYEKNNLKCWFDNGNEIEKNDKKKLQEYINNMGKIKDNIKLGTKNKMDFYLLLYCLWYKIQNNSNIDEYYQGIQDVFNITNKYSSNIYNICLLSNMDSNMSFEEIVIKTITLDFIEFTQEYTRPFCFINNEKENTYPDCGETTIRNLINLLCFDISTGGFDIQILREHSAIPELITYYKFFPNFEEQSSYNKKLIYGLQLDARDAWSYLVIHHANNNLTFNQQCSNNSNHKYNLAASSKTLDGNNINSLQLINNLLNGITKWENLEKNNIESIVSELDENGIGIIVIDHKIFGNIKIEYISGHAFWHEREKQTNFNISHLSQRQKTMINILTKSQEITKSNYLFFQYKENILDILNSIQYDDFELYNILVKISLTKIINSEIRKQISIDIKDIKDTIAQYKHKKEINDYIYIDTNFEFITKYIPNLKNLNCKISNIIRSIDLLPLSNIISIGDDFLASCTKLKLIDLSPLINIKSIGNYFLYACSRLTNIDLSPLCNITSINNSFLADCKKLIHIDLSPLSNITTIGHNFLSNCSNLKNIDLSPLINIKSVGITFLAKCSKLETINLGPLANITSINGEFLYGCTSLATINLEPLSNVTSISMNFLARCSSLTTINLTPLSNVTSISSYFLARCSSLATINLTPLSNITSISSYFLARCTSLTEINLTPLSNITSISSYFLHECTSLTEINLTPLSNITSISSYFLARCTSLTEINLTPLSNVTSISSNFLSECTSLTTINLEPLCNVVSISYGFLVDCIHLTSLDLNPLSNITIIDDNFLANCSSLTSITLSQLINLNSIGDNFLYNSHLTEIDLSTLVNLNSIGHHFMLDCNKLTKIVLPLSDNITVINANFLLKCKSLIEIDLTSIPNIKSIGDNFLHECINLTNIVLPLSNITLIGDYFLYECTSLTKIDLSRLVNLNSIGHYFMSNCTSLTKIDLSFLSNISKIGDGFLVNCTSLTEIDLRPLVKLEIIGNDFLHNCLHLKVIITENQKQLIEKYVDSKMILIKDNL